MDLSAAIAQYDRMRLFSKPMQARISPFDVLLDKIASAAKGITLPNPIPQLYNGIEGVVIIGAEINKPAFEGKCAATGLDIETPAFEGKCAIRFQGLDANIANDMKTPMDYENSKDSWIAVVAGLRRGVQFELGPAVYDAFEFPGALVRAGQNKVKKMINLNINCVELFK